jgi:hypothetical protein
MKNRILIGGGLVLLLGVLGLVWFSSSNSNKDNPGEVASTQFVIKEVPRDIVLDFYGPWLDAVRSTTTDPYQAGLGEAPILSPAQRTKIAEAKNTSSAIDPVTCQTAAPEKIISKVLYELNDKAQILVIAKDDNLKGQAVVTLNRLNEGWYIDDISCSAGEVPPEREFTFEREGFLLKSVVEPLNPEYWHLIYEENGQLGNAAPLFFSEESTCIDVEGNSETCDATKFMETTKAVVKGEMTESGVKVSRLEVIK